MHSVNHVSSEERKHFPCFNDIFMFIAFKELFWNLASSDSLSCIVANDIY